jgi:hypothetical protein
MRRIIAGKFNHHTPVVLQVDQFLLTPHSIGNIPQEVLQAQQALKELFLLAP